MKKFYYEYSQTNWVEKKKATKPFNSQIIFVNEAFIVR